MALLAVMAVVAIGLSIAGPGWSAQWHRERERELLRVGALYERALADYHENAPGSLKAYPASLDELLLDRRFVGVRRHMRQLYPDPLDPSRAWGLVRDDGGGITGIYSQSQDATVASGPVNLGDFVLPPARRYCDWKFSPVHP